MFFVAREEVTGVTEHRGSTNTPLVIHTGKPCVRGRSKRIHNHGNSAIDRFSAMIDMIGIAIILVQLLTLTNFWLEIRNP